MQQKDTRVHSSQKEDLRVHGSIEVAKTMSLMSQGSLSPSSRSSNSSEGAPTAKEKTSQKAPSPSSSLSDQAGSATKKQAQEPLPPYVTTDSARTEGSTSTSDEGGNEGSSSGGNEGSASGNSDEAMEVAEAMTAMSQSASLAPSSNSNSTTGAKVTSRSSSSITNGSSSDGRGSATKKEMQGKLPPYVTTDCTTNAGSTSGTTASDEATCPSDEATRNESSNLSEDDTGSDQSAPHPVHGSSMPLRKRFRRENNCGITQRSLEDHNVRMQIAEDMRNLDKQKG